MGRFLTIIFSLFTLVNTCINSFEFQYDIGNYRLFVGEINGVLKVKYTNYQAHRLRFWQLFPYRYDETDSSMIRSLLDRSSIEVPYSSFVDELANYSASISTDDLYGWCYLNHIDHEVVRGVFFEKGLIPFVKKNRQALEKLYYFHELEFGEPREERLLEFSEKGCRGFGYYRLAQALGKASINGVKYQFPEEGTRYSKFYQGAWKIKNKPLPALKPNKPYTYTRPILTIANADNFTDPERSAEKGINFLTSLFRKEHLPVVYLVKNPFTTSWYTRDREPSLAIFSENGENKVRSRPGHVFLAGGVFANELRTSGDLVTAMHDMIAAHFSYTNDRINFYMYLPAVVASKDEDKDYGGVSRREELIAMAEDKPLVFVHSLLRPLLFSSDSNIISHSDVGNLEDLSDYYFGSIKKSSDLLSLKEFQIEVKVNSQMVTKIGSGRKKICLNFYTKGSSLEALIKQLY